MEVKIIPAILTNSETDLQEKLRRAEGVVERVQIDIVGKAFSEKTTVGVEIFEKISTSLLMDAHLMVKEPISFLNHCDLGGVNRVFGHIEYMKSPEEYIEYAVSLGMQVGLALDLRTPVQRIETLIDNLDGVLLMSVAAGKSGQKFNEAVVAKIEAVRELNERIPICIDGGINPETIAGCAQAGADEFGVTSFLWGSGEISEPIRSLKEAV